MKIGYPCINRSLESSSCKTFRLASYSEERLIETVKNNLKGLQDILNFNLTYNLLFFRITSDLIPFASHSINTFNWQDYFKAEFDEIGKFIRKHKMRISMHPDQFVLINSPKEQIFENSIRELKYHADILNLLGLDTTHKLQIHVGGVYGDKNQSVKRFINRYKLLPKEIMERLCIENDDRLFSVKDCHHIHKETGIPIIFDNFHHELNNNDETVQEAGSIAFSTWDTEKDGIPMIDYSSQDLTEGKRTGRHTDSVVLEDFQRFLRDMKTYDFDVMLEVKDKEKSALKAIQDLNKT